MMKKIKQYRALNTKQKQDFWHLNGISFLFTLVVAVTVGSFATLLPQGIEKAEAYFDLILMTDNKFSRDYKNRGEVELTSLFEQDQFPDESHYFLPDGTDLRKLSYAVAMHETRNCEIVTNFTVHNNCHGFRWNGRIYEFDHTDESHAYFKDLWRRKYGRFPDMALAQMYSGSDRANYWLANVKFFYGQEENKSL